MRNYMKPELSVKKFVSSEAIADSVSDFLSTSGISSDAGITAYMYNSTNGQFVLDTEVGNGTGTTTVGELLGQ